MEYKSTGIILELTHYKEADKLAKIFTLENGIVSAKFVGVKKEKAKFKAVAQPLVYADFIINKNGQTNTIIQAEIIDSFAGILSNYNKTMCAYIVLDIVRSILPTEKIEQDLFMLTLASLKNIEEKNELVSLIDYILKFCSFSGTELLFADANKSIYLDINSGNFTNLKDVNFSLIDKKVYSTIFDINNQTKREYKEAELKQALHLLHNIIYLKFDANIKSFQFI